MYQERDFSVQTLTDSAIIVLCSLRVGEISDPSCKNVNLGQRPSPIISIRWHHIPPCTLNLVPLDISNSFLTSFHKLISNCHRQILDIFVALNLDRNADCDYSAQLDSSEFDVSPWKLLASLSLKLLQQYASADSDRCQSRLCNQRLRVITWEMSLKILIRFSGFCNYHLYVRMSTSSSIIMIFIIKIFVIKILHINLTMSSVIIQALSSVALPSNCHLEEEQMFSPEKSASLMSSSLATSPMVSSSLVSLSLLSSSLVSSSPVSSSSHSSL